MTDSSTGQTVSVVGLGLMGTALAQAFLANKHRVTVWNRTPSKCAPLAQAGAQVASSVAEAADASQIMVVCVLNSPINDSLLHTPEVSARLTGKTVVQLTTGVQQDARQGEAWAKQHGIAYLDGAILGYPKDIGTPEGVIFYAGSQTVFDSTRPVLRSLGGHPFFAGEDIGSAAILDGALIGSFVAGSVLSFLHGAALCEAEGVPLDTYLSAAGQHVMPGLIANNMQLAVEMVTKGSYAGTQATLDTWAAALSSFAEICRDSGVDDTYQEGLLRYMQQAQAQGHGQDEVAAVFECFRKKPEQAQAK